MTTSLPAATERGRALHLFVQCGSWVVSFTAGDVERLLLPGEAVVEVDSGGPEGCLGRLTADGRRYSAWDLGILLGLEPQGEAFVLLAGRGAHVPALALRTGACLSVGPLPSGRAAPVPPRAFRSRRGAVAAAFLPAKALQRRSAASVGLALRPSLLLSVGEAAHARSSLAGEGGR